MSDLFPDLPVVLSPRLKWMQEHGVQTKIWLKEGETSPWTGKRGPEWEAYSPNADAPEGYGDTEDEAIQDLAISNNWKLWNEV